MADRSAAVVKSCTKCGREFPATAEFFHVNTYRGQWHLRPDCKECVNKRNREWAVANAEKKRASDKRYHMEHRDERVARGRAAYAEKKAAGLLKPQTYTPEQRVQTRVRSKQWKAKNHARVLSNVRNRKARKKGNGGTHTDADVQAQYDRQKGRCYWCEVKVGDKYHVDHVVPIFRGGSNGPENIVIACAPCNLSKGSKHPMDFCGRLL